jgi:hypothetical protein
MNTRDIIGYDYVEQICSSNTISGRVNTYADLGSAAIHVDEWWIVNQSSGVWFVNRHERGFYYSDGSSWYYAPDLDQDLKTTANPRFASVVITDISNNKARLVYSGGRVYIQKETSPGVWANLASW